VNPGLQGRNVLITGASGGIGRAIAEAFAAEGANLALLGNRHSEELAAFVAGQSWAERAFLASADVSRADEVDAAFDLAREHFGRLDVCVSCAGLWPKEDTPLHGMHAERVENTIGTNLLGSIWTARAFLRGLAEDGPHADGGGASLVLIGSTAARFGESGHADYAAAKAGLQGLLLSLKNEMPDIDPRGRVNLIEPGWTATHMARPALDDDDRLRAAVRTSALRQIGNASDVAAATVFLSSPTLSAHLSGVTLPVSGGMEGRVLWDPVDIDLDSIRTRIERARTPGA